MTSEVDIPAERAARVAARASVVDVRLFKVSADLASIPAGTQRLTWDLEVRPAAEYSEGDSYFVVRISYAIGISEENESDDPPGTGESASIASISFEMGALYQLDGDDLNDPITADEIDSFAQTSSMFSMYPYAREYVHNVTMRLGLPPLVMKTFHLPYPVAQPK